MEQWTDLIYFAPFAGLLAMQFGLFDFSGGHEEVLAEDDPDTFYDNGGGDFFAYSGGDDYAQAFDQDLAFFLNDDNDTVADVPQHSAPAFVEATAEEVGLEDDDAHEDLAPFVLSEIDRVDDRDVIELETVVEVLGPDAIAAHFEDFDGVTDTLEIQYSASAFGIEENDPAPDVEVAYDTDADVTTVALDGAEVATLAGDVALAPGDITVTEIV